MEKETVTQQKRINDSGRIVLNCNEQEFFKIMNDHPHIFFTLNITNIPYYLNEFFFAKRKNKSFYYFAVRRGYRVSTYIFKGKIIKSNEDKVLLEYNIRRSIFSHIIGVISIVFLYFYFLCTFIDYSITDVKIWCLRGPVLGFIALMTYLEFFSNKESRDKAKDLFQELYEKYIYYSKKEKTSGDSH